MLELPDYSGEVCGRRQNYTGHTCSDHDPKTDNGGVENVLSNFFDQAAFRYFGALIIVSHLESAASGLS